MQYNLKEKIEVTEEFLNELIHKSWQETESIQQQIANIDISTKLGAEVAKLLKNTCTNYYILIGCLEALTENSDINCVEDAEQETLKNILDPEIFEEPAIAEETSNETLNLPTACSEGFEPFEYFVDFEEPYGEPISDQDLYG